MKYSKNEIRRTIEHARSILSTMNDKERSMFRAAVQSVMVQEYGKGKSKYPRYDEEVQRQMNEEEDESVTFSPDPIEEPVMPVYRDPYLPFYGTEPADRTRCAAIKNVGTLFVPKRVQCSEPKGFGKGGNYCEACAAKMMGIRVTV